MKIPFFNAMALLALVLSVSSCRTTKHLLPLDTPGEAYVELKTGEKYVGKKVETGGRIFDNSKINLDGKAFKEKDVAFYSDGKYTYGSVGKHEFATLVAVGKIGLFRSSWTTTEMDYTAPRISNPSSVIMNSSHPATGSSTTTKRHVAYYIQEKEGAQLKGLTYKNLKPMVMPNTLEHDMLRKFEKSRTVSRIIGYGIIGMVATGLIAPNSDAAIMVGGTGVLLIVPWAFYKMSLKGKLMKTVFIADNLKPDRH